MSDPLFVSTERAAELLGEISVSTVEKLIRKGELTLRKISANRVGIRYADLVKWAEERPVSDIKPGPGRKAPPSDPTAA